MRVECPKCKKLYSDQETPCPYCEYERPLIDPSEEMGSQATSPNSQLFMKRQFSTLNLKLEDLQQKVGCLYQYLIFQIAAAAFWVLWLFIQ